MQCDPFGLHLAVRLGKQGQPACIVINICTKYVRKPSFDSRRNYSVCYKTRHMCVSASLPHQPTTQQIILPSRTGPARDQRSCVYILGCRYFLVGSRVTCNLTVIRSLLHPGQNRPRSSFRGRGHLFFLLSDQAPQSVAGALNTLLIKDIVHPGNSESIVFVFYQFQTRIDSNFPSLVFRVTQKGDECLAFSPLNSSNIVHIPINGCANLFPSSKREGNNRVAVSVVAQK